MTDTLPSTTGTEPSERYERGKAVLASMGNDPEGIARWRDVDPVVGPELDRMLGEFCFGDVWARDGLDLRTRRIVTLTTIAVLGRMTLLKVHVKAALEQGLSRREILEVFTHMIAYAGFPVALSSIQIAQEAFAEIDGDIE
jgi:4-carboxymuconolactone decarboxylase